MKTKEMNFYVHKDYLEKEKDSVCLYREVQFSEYDPWLKAKLIVEIPEKKIEITEDLFDRAWNKATDFYSQQAIKNVLKKELGFTDG